MKMRSTFPFFSFSFSFYSFFLFFFLGCLTCILCWRNSRTSSRRLPERENVMNFLHSIKLVDFSPNKMELEIPPLRYLRLRFVLYMFFHLLHVEFLVGLSFFIQVLLFHYLKRCYHKEYPSMHSRRSVRVLVGPVFWYSTVC